MLGKRQIFLSEQLFNLARTLQEYMDNLESMSSVPTFLNSFMFVAVNESQSNKVLIIGLLCRPTAPGGESDDEQRDGRPSVDFSDLDDDLEEY